MSGPAQFYCDQETDGGGWVMVGRGREGWTESYNGTGDPNQLHQNPTGPAAFTPVQLSSTTVDALLNGIKPQDLPDGMRLHRASFLRDSGVLTRVSTTGFGFQVEMTQAEGARGARIAEAPITFDERMSGESKLSGAIFVEELVMVTKGGLGRLAGAARRLVGR